MTFTPPGGQVRQQPTNTLSGSPFTERKERDSVTALHQLIRAEDLSVVFQPIVRADTLAVFAYEALTRCRLAAYKNPARLFEVAAQDGCAGRLGRLVRETAVSLGSGHPLFLNIHPKELDERWLVQPDDPIFFHDRAIYLEVTESVPLTHFELCNDIIRELRSRGDVRLVVDDLGAGYSNLKHILDLEPHVVKLDRELITGVTRGSRQQKLVRSMVRMCNDLDAKVVAEGVETFDEYVALKEAGVELLQGYFFAKPSYPPPKVGHFDIPAP